MSGASAASLADASASMPSGGCAHPSSTIVPSVVVTFRPRASHVDSIGFTGIINTPFPALVADRALCINRPPVANAGPDLIVDERSVVALSSAASTDLDTDPLTARWVQLSGPAVTVMNGVFTAPEVTAMLQCLEAAPVAEQHPKGDLGAGHLRRLEIAVDVLVGIEHALVDQLRGDHRGHRFPD